MVGIRVEGKHCPHMRGYPQCEPREAGDVSEGTHPPTPENAQATFRRECVESQSESTLED